MAVRESSKVHPKYKTKYRVKNWPEYEAGLRARGDITLCLSPRWSRTGSPVHGRRGGQRDYSDLAISTALSLRLLLRLHFRQTEGFIGSLFTWAGMELSVPDHTTLSRRGKTVSLPALERRDDGPLHLIVDSTGLKTLGSGEWNSYQHKVGSVSPRWARR